jgi:hypothetical protein
MEWWQKAVVVPVKRAWIVVAARLTTRRKKDGKIISSPPFILSVHSLTHSSPVKLSLSFCVCANVIISQSACMAVYILP